RVLELDRGDAVGGHDLRLRGQPAHDGGAEGEDVVDHEGDGGEEQGQAARQHGHAGQLLPDGEVAQGPHGQDLGPLTSVASLRSCELIFSRACSAVVGLIWKRTFRPCIVKLMVPPCSAKPSTSPTVSRPGRSSALSMAGTVARSEALTKTIC